VPDKASVDRAAGQAADSQERVAWVKLIQALASGLGITGLLPPSLEFTVGLDSLGTPIRAHLVPGQIDEVAMVVAGVHGSEQSGVEVADRLLAQLQVDKPFFTVIIVPRLFPDNVASRAAWEQKIAADQGKIALKKYRELRAKDDDPGRITAGKNAKDPNRQFPALGADLDVAKPVDSKGDPVEPGNIALMALIKQFAPRRIVSIHAQKDLQKAGIFADPHPSVAPGPLATSADELAIAAAKRAAALGVRVGGNTRDGGFSSLYPGQNPKISKEKMKQENAKGQSLGQWGPSKGITVLTVEVSEQYTSNGAVNDPKRGAELEAEATALREVVLGPPAAAVPATGGAPSGPGSTPAVPGGATPAPVQRLVMTRVAADAGNHAAAVAVQRMRAAAAEPLSSRMSPAADHRSCPATQTAEIRHRRQLCRFPPRRHLRDRRRNDEDGLCPVRRPARPRAGPTRREGSAQAHGDERDHRSRHPGRRSLCISPSGLHRTNPQPQAQGGQSAAEGKEDHQA